MERFVITANDLCNGLAVYLTAAGDWSCYLDDARTFTLDERADGLALGRQAEEVQRVVGAYEIEIEEGDFGLRPVRLRERIRAYGPSTHADFARADAPGHLNHADGVEPVRFSER